jgi:hypothetical protein
VCWVQVRFVWQVRCSGIVGWSVDPYHFALPLAAPPPPPLLHITRSVQIRSGHLPFPFFLLNIDSQSLPLFITSFFILFFNLSFGAQICSFSLFLEEFLFRIFGT